MRPGAADKTRRVPPVIHYSFFIIHFITSAVTAGGERCDMGNDINALSPAALAFLGDAVFDLLVRERLVSSADLPSGELHRLSAQRVNAKAQAQSARRLLSLLTEQEGDVFRWGRNAHTAHTPKNQSESDYHCATGLEALFGWLYLQGEAERIRELFGKIFGEEGISEAL